MEKNQKEKNNKKKMHLKIEEFLQFEIHLNQVILDHHYQEVQQLLKQKER